MPSRFLVAAVLLRASIPVNAAILSASDRIALPGQTAVVSLDFSSEGQPISGIQFDLEWDKILNLKLVVGDSLRPSSKRLFTASRGPRVRRCIIIGRDQAVLPEGALLKAFLIVDPQASPGKVQLRITNTVATDPAGNSTPLKPATVTIAIATGPAIRAITNAASLAATPLAPGEVMAIFGSGLSASGLSCSSAPTTCNNTSVLINGLLARVSFASAAHVQFIVPFGIAGTTAAVQVSNQGVISPPVYRNVAAVAPGLFTWSNTGSGQGLLLNSGGQQITAANPAQPSDTVTAYATGLGATTPAVADGAVTVGVVRATATISVTVGGLPAVVLFAGLSPGSIALYQVNFVVPAGLSANQTVVVSANTVPSNSVILPLAGTPMALRFVPVTACRVADTRNTTGPFGGPQIAGGATRAFTISSSICGIPVSAQAYSLNVSVVPAGALGYLTLWPMGQAQPVASTLNSLDGTITSNAAIVPAGTGGAISVFASDPTDVVLDINGYFLPASDPVGLAYYPVTPCRVADTRKAAAPLGGPSLTGGVGRTFPVLSATTCNIPASAQAYSLNLAVVPQGPLGYLTSWPTGFSKPVVSSLNALTGTVTANAAIVAAGIGGAIDIFASNNTDLVIDINGYFAPMALGGLSLRNVPACRVLDTRLPYGTPPFHGQRDVTIAGSTCAVPAGQAYVLSATIVPQGALGYLTLWPLGQSRPTVSTLNALDAAITSNMAIVPAISGSISAFATNPAYLILDVVGYFAP